MPQFQELGDTVVSDLIRYQPEPRRFILSLNIFETYTETALSAFFLNAASEAMRQHSRAGITRHSHFRLNPSRLFSMLRKLFASQRPACNCR
ncbi:hypothetical protein FVF58_36565 [Paraburkholderia panacisoli]|uniref:Uncharacterized protein n=1 Tax=Paraburkholderia panacisoli TaxID=2603818 RepID=A0A5B0GJT1_9BURK|nr:hypothetical protein [Paraburkholderia panacisoli]KAA1003562.1 hypothetical protein FVF58_36565 [Paraburkholderia panacisoli]